MSPINALINKYRIIFRTAGKYQKTLKQSKKIATEILINFENNIPIMLLESWVARVLYLVYLIEFGSKGTVSSLFNRVW